MENCLLKCGVLLILDIKLLYMWKHGLGTGIYSTKKNLLAFRCTILGNVQPVINCFVYNARASAVYSCLK